MKHHFNLLASALSVCAACSLATARDLTFEDRVRAQEAIERVRYSSRLGATERFESAVPRSVLEAKVQRYLRESLALKTLWNTPVTAEMLDRETQRILRSSRAPSRLREIVQALGNDWFLFEECVARATLTERLARNFQAGDRVLHGEERSEIEDMRNALGGLDPGQGAKVPIVEERDAFSFDPAQGGEAPKENRYSVEKMPFDAWWEGVGARLDAAQVAAVATPSPQTIARASLVLAGCLPDDTWDTALIDQVPEGRTEATMVWTGSEAIMWGGAVDKQTGGVYDPAMDTWRPTTLAGAPSGRSGHTAVWTGQEMIVYGGLSVWSADSDFGGRYDPVSDSWQPINSEGAPFPAFYHAAVWTGTEMLVWGGYYAFGARYNPSTDSWSPISTLGAPEERHLASAVWTGEEMIVWGGITKTGSVYLNTGGRYNPATDSWNPISAVNAPDGRTDHVAVWTGSSMIVWGGGIRNYPVYKTGGRYDPLTDSWTPTSLAGAPNQSQAPVAAWCGGRFVVWGGTGWTAGVYDAQTDSWLQMAMENSPPGRFGTAGVCAGDKFIVWGGADADQIVSSGGRYDPIANTWTPTSLGTAPASQAWGSSVWTGSEMIVWGGGNAGGQILRNSGGRYDPALDTWTATSMTGVPSRRAFHTAVWTGKKMIVWGGFSGGELDTGGQYDPLRDSWSATATPGGLGGKSYHTAVWTGKEMIVWGGTRYLNPTGTGGRYDPAKDSWKSVKPLDYPNDRRANHAAAWTGSRMLIWGGDNPHGLFIGGWLYDPSSDSWTAVSTENSPISPGGSTALWTGSRVLVWGGSRGGRYDPATNSWAPISELGAPGTRTRHSAIWTGREMVVWGGSFYDNSTYYRNDGGRYDPESDTWIPMSTHGAPAPRAGHNAAWTGDAMLVWGGTAEILLRSGGRYGVDVGCEFSLTAPADGAGVPAGTPARFEWKPANLKEFRVEFALQVDPFVVASTSGKKYLNSQTFTPKAKLWKKLVKQSAGGSLYWRVVGRAGPSSPPVTSEAFPFHLDP